MPIEYLDQYDRTVLIKIHNYISISIMEHDRKIKQNVLNVYDAFVSHWILIYTKIFDLS